MRELSYFLARGTRNGNCLEWDGAFDSWGAPVYKTKNKAGNWTNRPVRRAMAGLLDAPATIVASVTCGNPACIEPKHIVKMTRSKLQHRTAKLTGYGASEARRTAIAVKRRARGTVLSMEIAREIRASGLTSRQAAAKWGVSQATAVMVLGNRMYREAGFFTGLMSANSKWSARA